MWPEMSSYISVDIGMHTCSWLLQTVASVDVAKVLKCSDGNFGITIDLYSSRATQLCRVQVIACCMAVWLVHWPLQGVAASPSTARGEHGLLYSVRI